MTCDRPNSEALELWVTASENLGEDTEALSGLDLQIQQEPSNPELHARRAILLAGSSHPKIRNPEAALNSALRAEQLGCGRSRVALRAMAIAYASGGNYPKAVHCTIRAAFREMPYRDMTTDLVNLVTFLAQRPYHSPLWKDKQPDRRFHEFMVGGEISDRYVLMFSISTDRVFSLKAALPRRLPIPMITVRWSPKGYEVFRKDLWSMNEDGINPALKK